MRHAHAASLAEGCVSSVLRDERDLVDVARAARTMPQAPHCGKNGFSLAKKRSSARVKLVGVGLARATSRASGAAYEKTASETTAIDALSGAKTRLYSPSRPPARKRAAL